MWLINTETLKLESILDPWDVDIEYAILSHTWEGEEVSFQQMQDLDVARTLPGFHKIEKTCELARSQSLRYAWVDTCCIDKSSSSELSEAINSMFNWYKMATVCYAFLTDFPDWVKDSPSDDSDIINGLRDRVSDDNFDHFSHCRWFTRGWTLQELIAPRHLIFFNQAWRPLGTKGRLIDTLGDVTSIDTDALQGRDLSEFRVWQRMAWAADRHTTRVEDIAYCLLGIFDINMPLIYGEGYRAFQRLQEELIRSNNDISILWWSMDNYVEPKYRPHVYRNPDTFSKSLLRSPLAWSPAEFRGKGNDSRSRLYMSELDRSERLTLTLIHGSLVIRGKGMFCINHPPGGGQHQLDFYGNTEPRAVTMTTSGWAFSEWDDKQQRAFYPLDALLVSTLYFASHQETMRANKNRNLFNVTLSTSLMLPDTFQSPCKPKSVRVWPENRSCVPVCVLAYSKPELIFTSRSRYKLLGWISYDAIFQPKIWSPYEEIRFEFFFGTDNSTGPLEERIWGVNIKSDTGTEPSNCFDSTLRKYLSHGIDNISERMWMERSIANEFQQKSLQQWASGKRVFQHLCSDNVIRDFSYKTILEFKEPMTSQVAEFCAFRLVYEVGNPDLRWISAKLA